MSDPQHAMSDANDVPTRRADRLNFRRFGAVGSPLPIPVLILTLLLPAIASAITLPVQGVLRSQSGGPVTDGPYPIRFALYAAKDAKDPVFEETQIGVLVKGGMFATMLGADPKAKLDGDLFGKHDTLWFGATISIDPELPRVQVSYVPYAARALAADKLTGPLDGKQIAAGTVPLSAVGFSFAGSKQKGGPAQALDCTGCITATHLAKGAVAAKDVGYSVGKQDLSVQAAIDDINDKVRRTSGGIGIGLTPAASCTVDLASDHGGYCVGGVPARVVLVATDAKQMDATALPGQVVYRSDEEKAYMRVGKRWRKLMFAVECGDGVPEGSEQCDDGNQTQTDSCTNACKTNVCGDGHPLTGKEDCDDGNTDNTDACVTGCKAAKCGDGFLQAKVESCDGAELGPATCASVKGAGWTGTLKCAAGCKGFDTTGCAQPLGTASNPAASCKAILDANIGAKDGVFYLGKAGAAVKAWCDISGGGWTLAASWIPTGTANPKNWGRDAVGTGDPGPSVKHAIAFIEVLPKPTEMRFVYTGNGQTFTRKIKAGAAWQEASGAGARIAADGGGYLIFGQQTSPSGICVVSGNYSDGYACDGNSSQINGQGLFNPNSADEACNCSSYGWKQSTGGCNVSVCTPTALVAVYLR